MLVALSRLLLRDVGGVTGPASQTSKYSSNFSARGSCRRGRTGQDSNLASDAAGHCYGMGGIRSAVGKTHPRLACCSFRTQRDHWVSARRPPRRNVTRKQGRGEEQERDGCDGWQ